MDRNFINDLIGAGGDEGIYIGKRESENSNIILVDFVSKERLSNHCNYLEIGRAGEGKGFYLSEEE